jgi:hypothetical protein
MPWEIVTEEEMCKEMAELEATQPAVASFSEDQRAPLPVLQATARQNVLKRKSVLSVEIVAEGPSGLIAPPLSTPLLSI